MCIYGLWEFNGFGSVHAINLIAAHTHICYAKALKYINFTHMSARRGQRAVALRIGSGRFNQEPPHSYGLSTGQILALGESSNAQKVKFYENRNLQGNQTAKPQAIVYSGSILVKA